MSSDTAHDGVKAEPALPSSPLSAHEEEKEAQNALREIGFTIL